MRDLWCDRWPMVLFGLVCAVVVAMLIWIGVDGARWARFAEAHNCRVIAEHQEPYTHLVIVGKVMVPVSGTRTVHTYACDDGNIYTR